MMSVINDTVRRLDVYLDRIQLQIVEKLRLEDVEDTSKTNIMTNGITDLQEIVRAISVTSAPKPLLRPDRLADLLSKISFAQPERSESSQHVRLSYASDLVWLVAAKAAVHTLGLVMHSFLEQTLILSDEIWYWDQILGSFWYTALYSVQTSPIRFWHRAKGLYSELRDHAAEAPLLTSSIATRWAQFYGLLQQSINSQSGDFRARFMSPLRLAKSEVRHNRKLLKATKGIHASSIGLLMEECLSLGTNDDVLTGASYGPDKEEWRVTVVKSVILIEKVLQNVTTDISVPEFEEVVFAALERDVDPHRIRLDGELTIQQSELVIERLVGILQNLLPNYTNMSRTLVRKHGRPPHLVRYWLPLSVVAFSASTFLSILTSRRAELTRWIADAGSTAVDFWGNWVVEPIRKLIGTIRHDEKSEIAIMSKNSLEADRASLERMVVDFVIDRPELGQDLSIADTEAITVKVKEGDLTPVLRAYERDLRTPFVGTIRGDLIRALLIQIQKTKVDVEIAISGIDALLKSQELVFGFVGLTPGILVSYACFRWLCGLLGNRKGLQMGKKQHDLRRALRNIDRTLTSSSPTVTGTLSYKDHGLLICETEVLLQKARDNLKGAQYREFQEDIKDLLNIQLGIDKQLKVIGRIGWAYSIWFRF